MIPFSDTSVRLTFSRIKQIAGWLCIAIIFYATLTGPGFTDTHTTGEAENPPGDTGLQHTPVDEVQVRKVLLDILSQADKPAVSQQRSDQGSSGSGEEFAYSESVLENWTPTETNKLAARLRQLKRELPGLWSELQAAFALATTPEEGVDGSRLALILLMNLALGLALEYFTTRPLLKRLYQYAQAQEKTTTLKVKFIFTRALIQILGLVILAVTTYACTLFFIKQNLYFEMLFIEFLKAFLFFRFGVLVVRNILSPYFEPLRLVNLNDETAKKLYYWSIVFFAVYAATEVITEYLLETDMSNLLISGLLIPFSLILNSIILSAVWGLRNRITAMFVDEESQTHQSSFASRFFVQFWPFFFTVWLITIWMLWLYRMLQGQPEMARGVGIAWIITLAFPIADRMFNGLLQNVVRIPWLQSPSFKRRSARFIRIVQTGFRVILLTISIVTVLHSWGVNATGMVMSDDSGGIGEQIIDFLLIATFAYVFWELMHALIERKLPEEESGLASLEGDGGGAGATREETLLPLVRTTLTVILVIIFALSLLHAAGVAITPLLAGAGVVGIAVGFGAQKLVQDILSGVFFLVDDAFRKGEYIEMDNLRGTVEKISLRSMQLRHHLGAVQTVPYSEIKTVTNLSRDWITMKLELRLPYDADIEKVRKIIKKVGQEMLKDEEMGPSFILPLKSQGVMRMEESALIVRMKFTARPGEQWIIRREAYRRVRDALAAAGIHFAHREVRVVLPEDPNSQSAANDENPENSRMPAPPEENQLQKAAAAAVTSMLATEAARDKSSDGDSEIGGDDR